MIQWDSGRHPSPTLFSTPILPPVVPHHTAASPRPSTAALLPKYQSATNPYTATYLAGHYAADPDPVAFSKCHSRTTLPVCRLRRSGGMYIAHLLVNNADHKSDISIPELSP